MRKDGSSSQPNGKSFLLTLRCFKTVRQSLRYGVGISFIRCVHLFITDTLERKPWVVGTKYLGTSSSNALSPRSTENPISSQGKMQLESDSHLGTEWLLNSCHWLNFYLMYGQNVGEGIILMKEPCCWRCCVPLVPPVVVMKAPQIWYIPTDTVFPK